MIHTKSEVRNHIINFTLYVETQFHKKIKTIRIDNGPVFSMHAFFASKGITHQTSCVETPQQNGIVECKHQHLLNVTRALLFQASLPFLFWEFAITHVAFLINSTPTPLLSNLAPHEKLYGSKCDLSFLKIFGCLCYSSTLTANRKKLDDKAIKVVFLGFPHNTKGYIILNLKYHRIEISRHVIFHETHFPYKLDNDLDRGLNTLSLPIPTNYNFDYDFCVEPTPTHDHAPANNILPAATTPPRRSQRMHRPFLSC